MTHRQIRAGVIANVIVFGAIALVWITGGWFMVALLIAAFAAAIFMAGSGAA